MYFFLCLHFPMGFQKLICIQVNFQLDLYILNMPVCNLLFIFYLVSQKVIIRCEWSFLMPNGLRIKRDLTNSTTPATFYFPPVMKSYQFDNSIFKSNKNEKYSLMKDSLSKYVMNYFKNLNSFCLMAASTCPSLQQCWHKLRIHCPHQTSSPLFLETISLVPLQHAPKYDQLRHSKKLILHQP